MPMQIIEKKGTFPVIIFFIFIIMSVVYSHYYKNTVIESHSHESCIQYLTSEKLEGRGLGTQGIHDACGFISQQFSEIGLKPIESNGDFFQPFTAHISGKKFSVINVVGIITGKNKDENIVIGAHYDHLGYGELVVKEEKYKGKIHPGANDNASGVAVLLEVARSLANKNFQPERNIVFIAFSGEETGRIGSKYYVNNMLPEKKCIAMINLDTIGKIKKNKVFVIGAQSAKEWEEILRVATDSVGVEPIFVKEDLDSSDQKSFHEAGIPAIQLFSGPDLNYHRPTDTAEKINFGGLVKATKFTEEIVKRLVGHRDLTSNLKLEGVQSPAPREKIKVSFGTIPDFAYQGIGYCLAGVKPESPASKAGLEAGDIITKINNREIIDLRTFADVLRSLKGGDKISVIFLRNKEKREIIVTLK